MSAKLCGKFFDGVTMDHKEGGCNLRFKHKTIDDGIPFVVSIETNVRKLKENKDNRGNGCISNILQGLVQSTENPKFSKRLMENLVCYQLLN